MSRVLRVALAQTPLEWEDPAANRARFDALLAPLAGRTDLVVLPEMFTTGFSMQPERVAEAPEGPTWRWLRELAARLDAAVTGSVACIEHGACSNRLLWATPDGALRQYDKRHLFRMAGEHQHYVPGREGLVVEWRGARIAPLICYDLRFPVFSRRRQGFDYDVLLYVANWPRPRREAWRALLVARAIENQCFVLGVNRVGTDGLGHPYAGDSLAVDARGGLRLDAGDAPGVHETTLDLDALAEFRDRFPAHLDADRFTLIG